MHSEIFRSFAQSVFECNTGFQLEHLRPGWAVESILVSFVPLCKTHDTNQLRPNDSTRYDGLLGYTVDNFWMGAGVASGTDPSFEPRLSNFQALFGIFTAFGYGGWDNAYRQYHDLTERILPSYDPVG